MEFRSEAEPRNEKIKLDLKMSKLKLSPLCASVPLPLCPFTTRTP